MTRTKIRSLLRSKEPRDRVCIAGWVRTRRDSKDFSFIEVNDGSCLSNMQVIADAGLPNAEEIRKLGTGSSVAIVGNLVASPGQGQKWKSGPNRWK